MGVFSKTGSSRIIKAYNLAWTGGGTAVSTNFTSETFQVRVISPVAGYVAIDNLGTVPTTAGATGTYIAASTANGDYFQCVPGMLLSFSSTSTSTGSVNVSEMA